MAKARGGPPRRSHQKSRKGCETCKRRHVRCDETFPQCGNCIRHRCRCSYLDLQAQDERAAALERPVLRCRSKVNAYVEPEGQAGGGPFPGLSTFQTIAPELFHFEDLRLIHHVVAMSVKLRTNDAWSFTIWSDQIPLFLRLGATHGFVMDAFLALSSIHIAWVTGCPLVSDLAYKHRGVALSGLQEAVGAFSSDNSDAVLAASFLLSWQAPDWHIWTQFIHGTSSIIDPMEPLENESQFDDVTAFLSESPSTPSSTVFGEKEPDQCRKEELEALQCSYSQLRHIETILGEDKECPVAIAQLLSFLDRIHKPLNHTNTQRLGIFSPSCP